MQINRHQNFETETVQHPLAKSKSPDNLRQKIPTFKPKTLEQIFQQTKRKKSFDKTDKEPYNLKDSAPLNKKSLPVKQQKPSSKNSLAFLIAQSGHNDDIQSIQYTNSQIQDKYAEQDFDKYLQSKKQSEKYEVRVFIPQCVPFSKLNKDLFKCKDDISMYEDDTPQSQQKTTHWNGEITLATSMCEEEFQKVLQQDDQIPNEYRGFVESKCFYVLSVNSQNQSEYLMESGDGFELGKLTERLLELQGGKAKGINKTKLEKAASTQTIKFLSVAEMNEFLAPQQTHQHIERYLTENLGKKKFTSLIYFVEAGTINSK